MAGATPVAATNCLNFGNPEKPEIMAQLSAAIDGIGEACIALGTPITGGNVSLYNETKGEGIYPTPVLGVVGILDDVTRAVPAAFQQAGDDILLLWPVSRGEEPNPDLAVPFTPAPINPYIVAGLDPNPAFPVAAPLTTPVPDAPTDTLDSPFKELAAFGSSEFAKSVLGEFWGTPPALDLEAESGLHKLLVELGWRQLIRSARDIGDGGIAVALAQAAFPLGIGAKVDQEQSLMIHPLFGLFAEPASIVLVTTASSNIAEIEKLAEEYNFLCARIGVTGGSRLEITVDGEPFISASLAELREPWARSLEAALHNEVTA
jgi:phosphoribosylformylglycinamidine synthase